MSATTQQPVMLSTAAVVASQGFAKIAVVSMTAITALLAVLQTDAVQSQAGGTTDHAIVISSDPTLRLWCLLGALLGALLRICLHPPKSPAGFARSFSACLITGVLGTPMAVHYFGIEPNSDGILLVSGLVAFLAYIALEGAEVKFRKWMATRAGAASGTPPPTPPAA